MYRWIAMIVICVTIANKVTIHSIHSIHSIRLICLRKVVTILIWNLNTIRLVIICCDGLHVIICGLQCGCKLLNSGFFDQTPHRDDRKGVERSFSEKK